jgi:hypothetical protein
VVACHYCNEALGPYSLTISDATSETIRAGQSLG